MCPARRRRAQQDLVLFDRKGGAEPLKLPPGEYEFPRVSPDGKRIAFETTDGKEAVISIYELSGASSLRRLTFGGNNRFPIWSADGRAWRFNPIARAIRRSSGSRPTAAPRSASRNPTPARPCAGVVVSRRRRAAVQRDEGLRCTSLWTFSLEDRKATPFSDVRGSSLPTDAVVLARRPLGRVPDRRTPESRRHDVRRAVPADRHEVSDCAEAAGRCGPATARSCSSCRRRAGSWPSP